MHPKYFGTVNFAGDLYSEVHWGKCYSLVQIIWLSLDGMHVLSCGTFRRSWDNAADVCLSVVSRTLPNQANTRQAIQARVSPPVDSFWFSCRV